MAALALSAGCQSAQPFEVTDTSSTESGAFRVGIATKTYTPESGYPLGGYGGGARRAELPFYAGMGWPGRLALCAHQSWHEDEHDGRSDMLVPARGAHEDLGARALVIRSERGPPLALVRIDAIGTTRALGDLVLEQVKDLGYRESTLWISATHTHSGPGAFFRAPVASLIAMDNYRRELEDSIATAIAESIREAHARARPAAIAVLSALDEGPEGQPLVARNRRARRFRDEIRYDAIDNEIGLLYFVERDSRQPIALLLNYAVHPTVLGADSLHFSRDVAGAIERRVATVAGAPVLFVNGAEGDVAPRRVKAAGGLLRCEELGEVMAGLVAPVLSQSRGSEGAFHGELEVRAVTGDKELGDPRGIVALGRERFLDAEQSWASWPLQIVTLPVNLVLWTVGLTNLRVELTWNLALGVVAHLDGLTPRTVTRAGALRLRAGPHDVVVVSMPGEPTHDVGLEAKRRAKDAGASTAMFFGLTHDHIGYVASRKEYRRGGYEAHSTLFGPNTAEELLKATDRAREALFSD